MTYNSLTRLDYNSFGNSKTVKVQIGEEEKEYVVVSENITCESVYTDFHSYRGQTVYSYELHEIIKVKIKTPEQIAAEESVTKAKEALKAAENALKIVKEQKK
jgi:hypothetical protein